LETAKNRARSAGQPTLARQIKREQRRLADQMHDLNDLQTDLLDLVDANAVARGLAAAMRIARDERDRLEQIARALRAAQAIVSQVTRVIALLP